MGGGESPLLEVFMQDTIEWIRPSGLPIITRNTREMSSYAESAGWEMVDASEALDREDNDSDVDHVSAINSMQNKQDVLDYMISINMKIDGRGHLSTVRNRALGVINDNCDTDN